MVSDDDDLKQAKKQSQVPLDPRDSLDTHRNLADYEASQLRDSIEPNQVNLGRLRAIPVIWGNFPFCLYVFGRFAYIVIANKSLSYIIYVFMYFSYEVKPI